MLDQVALACAVRDHIGQELPHHVKLMVAREDLLALLLAGLRIHFLDDLRVILKDIGQALRCE